MKRAKNNLRYSERRRMYLDATRFGPALKLTLWVLLALVLAAVAALLLMPRRGGSFVGVARTPELSETALPAASALLPIERGTSIADITGYGGALLFAAGKEPGKPDTLLRFDPASETLETVPAPLFHDFLRYPVEDGERLLYLDCKAEGGGTVRMLDKASGKTEALYEFLTGAPGLAYEAPYLAFTERMADGTAALRVLDVTSREIVTVADFDRGVYGSSMAALCSGQLIYADEDPEAAGTSRIRTVLLQSGERWDYRPGGFVYAPQSAGDRWAWLNGARGPEAALAVFVGGGQKKTVAAGVNAFFITPGHVVYGKDTAVYAYDFRGGAASAVGDPASDCLPVGAGGGYAVWQDMETGLYYYRKLD